MDVFLLAGVLSLSASMSPTYVLNTNHHPVNKSRKGLSPLSISFGLSFSLFALSVLEATPYSWLIMLDNRIVGPPTTDDGSSRDDNEYYLSVSYAYFVILSVLAGYVLLISPAMAGVMVLDKLFHFSAGNLLCCFCKDKPWWLKLITGTISFIYKGILVLLNTVLAVVQVCWRLYSKRGNKSKKDSCHGLPASIIDPEARSRNPLVAMQCLMSSFYQLLLFRGGIWLTGSVLGIAATLAALHWLAPFIISPKYETVENFLAVSVCWMTSIGIVLSQVVNGFGSVSMPHSCLAGLYLEPIRPETVSKATVDLEKTRESLEARKVKLKEMQWKKVSPTSSISPSNVSNATTTSRWSIGTSRPTKRTFSSIGEEVKQQKEKLMQEIRFLETLVEEMTEDVDDMKYTQQMEAASRTTVGRIKSWLGVMFSVVLLARLYFAGVAIWRHWYSDMGAGEQTKKDPVTTALLFLVGHHMVTEKEYDELSQVISLLLTAMLTFSQIRAFLRTAAAIHRRLNHLFLCSSRTNDRLTLRNDLSSGVADKSAAFLAGNGVYMHILAALMGSYFLACIVMTKTMLPWQYSASFSGALGGLDAFVIQSDVITALFAMSAVVSAVALALLFGIQKSNSTRHNVSWMDDLSSSTIRDLDV